MRKLGDVQLSVLQTLKEARGWPAHWQWDSPSNTNRILTSLAKRGLVTKSLADRRHGWPCYQINDAGLAKLEEIARTRVV